MYTGDITIIASIPTYCYTVYTAIRLTQYSMLYGRDTSLPLLKVMRCKHVYNLSFNH